MSAVYNHGQKFGMIPRSEGANPMKWVSATTVSDYEAISLSPEESFAILEGIKDPLVRVLVILVAVTAIRIGEALGLMWSDIEWKKLKINIRRDWVDGQLGRPKSRASKAAVEMHGCTRPLRPFWKAGVGKLRTARTRISYFRRSSVQAARQATTPWQHDRTGLHPAGGDSCRCDS